MRKRLILILMTALICFLALKLISKPYTNTDTIICRISNILNRNNSIDLKCVGIDKKDINITWDSEDTKPKLIFENGKQSKKIEHSYGPNRFEIQLTNGLKFNVGHFKTNNWHSHQYEIDLIKDSIRYDIKFVAKGPDFEWFEQSFNLSGVPNGKVCGYFYNGEYSFKGEYVNGLKQGQFVYYHRNGKIRSTADYLDDKLNGDKTDFDESGNLEWKTEYKNGQKIKKNE